MGNLFGTLQLTGCFLGFFLLGDGLHHFLQCPSQRVFFFGLQKKITAYHVQVRIGKTCVLVVNIGNEASQSIVIPRALRVRVVHQDVQLLLLLLVHVYDIDTDAVVVIGKLLQLVHDGQTLVPTDYGQTCTLVYHDSTHQAELLYSTLQYLPAFV